MSQNHQARIKQLDAAIGLLQAALEASTDDAERRLAAQAKLAAQQLRTVLLDQGARPADVPFVIHDGDGLGRSDDTPTAPLRVGARQPNEPDFAPNDKEPKR